MKRCDNLTQGEWDALYNLKNDKTIVMAGSDNGSAVVVWDRKDYIKKAENVPGNTNLYEEIPNNTKPFMNIILNTLENIHKRGDVCTDTLNYFKIQDVRFARFYLPKVHKRLFNVPGRPVISNCGWYAENISSFLDLYLQSIAKKFKSYIKETNNFIKKLHCLTNSPDSSYVR